MRFSPDIREAARDSVRQMIEFLVAEYGLSKIEAYMLCSVAGDLRMHEVVSILFVCFVALSSRGAGRHAKLCGQCAGL